MTDNSMTLLDLMQKTGDGDFLRTLAETVLQLLVEADVDGQTGSGRHEPYLAGSRVHWMRNALSYVTKDQNTIAAAALRRAFALPDAIIRLIGAVLLEINDNWIVQTRYMQVGGAAESSSTPNAIAKAAIPQNTA